MNLLNFYQKQTLFFLPNLQLQNQILQKKKKSHFKVLSKQWERNIHSPMGNYKQNIDDIFQIQLEI